MHEGAEIIAKKPKAKRNDLVSRIRKSDYSHSLNSPIAQILHLQTTIGNQAVQGLFESDVI